MFEKSLFNFLINSPFFRPYNPNERENENLKIYIENLDEEFIATLREVVRKKSNFDIILYTILYIIYYILYIVISLYIIWRGWDLTV